MAIALGLLISMFGAGTAFAAASVDSPGAVQSDTTQLNWTGQGATNGQYDNELCGDQADPGSGGYQNGATATDYMLWIFSTDGGSVSGSATLHIGPNSYSSSDGHQFVTPAYDLTTIGDVYTTFVVGDTGNGSWVLTLSHGCGDGTVPDVPIAPAGYIGGPCVDPAYYAVFDNSASSVAVRFRMVWRTRHLWHTTKKLVPAGAIFTTWQRWAKPGSEVSVWYKDPNTHVWVKLDSVVAVHGYYPACDYTPGWSYLT